MCRTATENAGEGHLAAALVRRPPEVRAHLALFESFQAVGHSCFGGNVSTAGPVYALRRASGAPENNSNVTGMQSTTVSCCV